MPYVALAPATREARDLPRPIDGRLFLLFGLSSSRQ